MLPAGAEHITLKILMETSLILLKPDCVAGRMVGEVIKRFEDDGFQIRGCKMFSASPELLKEHYSHLLDKSFFPQLEAFMQSTPVIALALTARKRRRPCPDDYRPD